LENQKARRKAKKIWGRRTISQKKRGEKKEPWALRHFGKRAPKGKVGDFKTMMKKRKPC